ncbi:MAG: hypothetical protein Q4G33_10035 [bacterium]|nr:hypothetical protein [bacterium]
MMENFLDDRVIIPEDIKRMTKSERKAEIARLEKEARREKLKSLSGQMSSKAA